MGTLYAIAQSWLGTPFQHQGRLKGIGVDCIGLVLEVYREAGVLQHLGLPQGWDYTGYKRQGVGQVMQRIIGQYLVKALPPYLAGAVGVFLCDGTQPTHVALLFPDGDSVAMIHSVDSAHDSSPRSKRKVQEHALRGFWAHRLRAVYAPPGWEEK
jgi:cell wall-associated NlpC family hydrolase